MPENIINLRPKTMASYVPGYDYDVFLSYSTANDEEGWVSEFQEALKNRLTEYVGKPGVTIFFDKRDLRKNEELTPEVLRGINSSAVLVSVVSRSYVTAPWCRRECAEFISVNQAKGINGRIFPVRYDDVSHAEYQALTGERTGYEFYEKSPFNGLPEEVKKTSAAFQSRMNGLRRAIGDKLRELRAAENQPAGEASTQKSLPTVFLAEPAPGLANEMTQLQSFLKAYYHVVRPGDRFYALENYAETFAQDVQRSILFVQLLGRKFAPTDGDAYSWDQWQFDQASRLKIPAMRWFNKHDKDRTVINLEELDAKHRAFVKQDAVWDCDFARFLDLVKTEIDKRFVELRQQERLANTSGLQPWVVLRADRSDRNFLDTIGKTLRQFRCDTVGVPDKAVTSLESLATNLAANGLVVVYKTCPGEWVSKRIQEIRTFKETDLGRSCTFGLWQEPAEDEDAFSFSIDGIHVINPRDTECVKQFVQQVHSRRPGVR